MNNFLENIDINIKLNNIFKNKFDIDLFDNKPSNQTKINRNSILHGSYNYDELSQNSYLKMIVLLKSALALIDVSPSELNLYLSVKEQ